MTLERDTAISVDRLGPSDLVETFGFLDREPVVNVYLLALTLRDGLSHARDEFWGARRDGEIVGLIHLGGQTGAILPIGRDPAALDVLARIAVDRLPHVPRRFQVIGPRPAVGAVTTQILKTGRLPRLERRQIYLSLAPADLRPFDRLPELRAATREDFDIAYESGALLRAEELEEDPRLTDPAGYSRRIEEECRDGHTQLWIDARGLCFRASVSALTPDAAQVSGVYTPPDRRNQGLARRALSELCTRLFERSRAVCLFVNDFNAPAISLYRRIGFRECAEWASAFFDGPR